MKIIKNKIGSLFQFYEKSKNKLFKKIMIVVTCLVCVFAPIHSNVKQVQAIALESAFVVGTVSLLALLGVGIADTVEPDNLYNACSDAIDGFKSFAGQLAGNVATNVTNFIDATVQTGQVALDAFNALYNELGQLTYNLFHDGTIEGTTTGVEFFDNFIPQVNFTSTPDFSFLNNTTQLMDNLATGLYNYVVDPINQVVVLFGTGIWFSCNPNGSYIMHNLTSNSITSTARYVRIYKNSGNSTGQYISYISDAGLGPLSTLLFSPNLYLNVAYEAMTLVYEMGKWMYGDLVLDPPMHQNPDLTLLDESYINYGDINDVAIPRYTGKDAVMNPDGTITDAGTYSIPNQYIPNLERPFPPVIPFPLPDIATIPNTWTGDITKDTPIEDTSDTDVTDPDYKVPVVGDFLGDYDVPGKLQWKEYFPFCIPFDLIKFLGVLSADPVAPNFTWNYNIVGTKGSIKIDLSEYETIALVGRTFFDLLFILGLTMATRNLIKG